MVLSGDVVLIGIILIACFLTLVAVRVNVLMFRMASAISWLALGIMLLLGTFSTTIADTWVQLLGFVSLLMTIAPLTLQMQTEIRREGKSKGYPGASSSSWTEWGPNPSKKKFSRNEQSNQRQDKYAAMLAERHNRIKPRRKKRKLL